MSDADDLASDLENFVAYLAQVRDFSPRTITVYKSAVEDFRRTLGIDDLRAARTEDLDRYLTRLGLRGIRANTRRSRLNALRALFRFLHSRGRIAADPAAPVHGPSQKETDRIPVLSEQEIVRLTFGYREPPIVRGRREPAAIFARRDRVARLKALRDTAMLSAAYSLGLRASELGTFRVEDFRQIGEPARPVLVLRESKWAREPVTFRLDAQVAAAIEGYLLARDSAGVRHPALFPPLAFRRRDTREPPRGISRNQVAAVLARRIAKAGIQPRGRRLSPHVLRYSAATHLYHAGMRDRELQAFLRHRSIETTYRYVRLGSERQIQGRAIALLFWNRRGTRAAARSG